MGRMFFPGEHIFAITIVVWRNAVTSDTIFRGIRQAQYRWVIQEMLSLEDTSGATKQEKSTALTDSVDFREEYKLN